MACDICGGNKERLVDLIDLYKTEEIKQVCIGCESDINKHLSKVRSVTHNILVSLMKRFMAERRSRD